MDYSESKTLHHNLVINNEDIGVNLKLNDTTVSIELVSYNGKNYKKRIGNINIDDFYNCLINDLDPLYGHILSKNFEINDKYDLLMNKDIVLKLINSALGMSI
jgi:hypothetical protein